MGAVSPGETLGTLYNTQQVAGRSNLNILTYIRLAMEW
jgi:hypothetical protein